MRIYLWIRAGISSISHLTANGTMTIIRVVTANAGKVWVLVWIICSQANLSCENQFVSTVSIFWDCQELKVTILSPRTWSTSITHLITDVIMTVIRELCLHATEEWVKISDIFLPDADLGHQEHLPLTYCRHFLNWILYSCSWKVYFKLKRKSISFKNFIFTLWRWAGKSSLFHCITDTIPTEIRGMFTDAGKVGIFIDSIFIPSTDLGGEVKLITTVSRNLET